MRKRMIAGNWKMNKISGDGTELAQEIVDRTREISGVEILVAPPFTILGQIAGSIKGAGIRLGAQNCSEQPSGAFTGEISLDMLKDMCCSHVIIGHSERRQYYGETDEIVNRKVKAVVAAGLVPIVCVGETLAEREGGVMRKVIEKQVTCGLSGLSLSEGASIILAYEPVWAIGTGKTASPADANEVHQFIRELLTKCFSMETADVIRVLYGGSVKPANARELMSEKDIDGALVGGASLDAESFSAIIASV